MSKISEKRSNILKRKLRIRGNIQGTSERPRLSVFISNLHVSAQIIDDTKQKTLVSASTHGKKTNDNNRTKQAEYVGKEIASKAKKAGIKRIVFDRNGRLYHGRVKAFAEAARSGGLEF